MKGFTFFKHLDEMDDKCIEKVREVLTQDWIDKTYKDIMTKNMHKEIGSHFNMAHPFIRNLIEIKMAMRRAEILDEDTILFNSGMFNYIELGRNLLELEGLYNLDLIRSRLKEKDLYDDACWELESAMALKYSGFKVEFVNEGDEKSYDIYAEYDNAGIAIECKNKHIQDEKHNKNSAFTNILANKVFKMLADYQKPIDIRVTIKDVGRIEDVKSITMTIKQMIDNGISTIEDFKSEYKLEIIQEYQGVSTGKVMRVGKEESCMTARQVQVNNLRTVFGDKVGNEYFYRLFMRFPSRDSVLKNLNSLISKANKQINGIQSCILLKVPIYEFDSAVRQISKMLLNDFSNISAVKIVSLKREFFEREGVRTVRHEKLIISDCAKISLNQKIKGILSQNIMFKKYKIIK